jgi:hypothetical protein
MPLPLIVLGGIVVGAFLIGRYNRKNREKELERQLNISESMRNREKKKTREELLKELHHD